jgi:Domain of unknown function (DUF4395)
MSPLAAAPGRPLFLFPERLTEAPVRLVASGVSLSILIGFALGAGWVLPLLALGFVLRVIAGPRFSPLARLAITLTQRLRLPKRSIAGAPKQFAAAIGAVVLTVASVLLLFGLHTAAWAVAGVVAFLAGLEAAFAFCLGCKIYQALFGCADCAAVPREGPGA